jgi:hypothetical protein
MFVYIYLHYLPCFLKYFITMVLKWLPKFISHIKQSLIFIKMATKIYKPHQTITIINI